MEMGHNTKDARYILTGNSNEEHEKGLAEMKRQIAAGITFSVCYGGDKNELEKEYDSEYSNDDRDVCEEDTDWDVCSVCTEEDCAACPFMDEDEEEVNEVKEVVDKNEVAAAIAQGIVAAFKDFLGM